MGATRIGRWAALLSICGMMLFSGLFGSTTSTISATCRLAVPRIVSHRGVDEDELGAKPSTLARIVALIDDGFSSFDLDLFWAADKDLASLFVGHPPSLRKLWGLTDEVHATPLATLRTRSQPDGLLPLHELLALLARRRSEVANGMVSLELKFPNHPEWRRKLGLLYSQIASHGVAPLVAAVVGGEGEAAAHREAQAKAGVRVALLCVLRDIDAPKGADGWPHANATAMAMTARSYDGWAPSWQLLEPNLRGATRGLPVSTWAVDTEEQLRRSFVYRPRDIISNRPRWARHTLARWHKEECGL